MSHPFELKERAIKYRKRGHSLEEISKRFLISKSTASAWSTGVELNDKAKLRLKKRGILGQYKSILLSKKKRARLLKNFRKIAQKDLVRAPKTARLCRLICSLLFWCEGSKSNTVVKFTNSDPAMVKCFLFTLRKGFNIDEKKLRGLVHIHSYHNEAKQIDFWSTITGIPKDQFYRSFKKPNTGKRIKKDYPGCVAVAYYDARVAKRLWAYYKEAQDVFS